MSTLTSESVSLGAHFSILRTYAWVQLLVPKPWNLQPVTVDVAKGPDLSYAGFVVGPTSHYKCIWKKESEGRLDTHKGWGRPFKCQARLP